MTSSFPNFLPRQLRSWGLQSGDKLEGKRDAFEQYLAGQDESYFETFQEAVSLDRGEPYATYGDYEQVVDTMFDWMNSTALRNRGLYATWTLFPFFGALYLINQCLFFVKQKRGQTVGRFLLQHINILAT